MFSFPKCGHGFILLVCNPTPLKASPCAVFLTRLPAIPAGPHHSGLPSISLFTFPSTPPSLISCDGGEGGGEIERG